ncbi:MAG: HD domain-containing protein [Helicobacteraceae bacterium]|jgi:guanosine-3',5'-bis(diphosphate) 3'-pyrophosphohydrolase|nr:HD domain-containing protein [Helicobacteraceae bacterium]
MQNAYALVFKALAFAAQKHRNQRRKSGEQEPFINHPIALANCLANEGAIDDADILCAAILHDTIEDTDTTAEELREIFGDTITELVLEVSDDKALDYAERKRLQIEHAPQSSHKAKQIKLADKICNMRDIVASPPPAWNAERRRAYCEWSKQVVDGIRDANAALAEKFDEIYAERLRPELGY